MKLETYISTVAQTPYYLWAKRFGYSQASVYAWIKGRRKPSLTNLQKIMRDTQGMVGPGDFNGNPQ